LGLWLEDGTTNRPLAAFYFKLRSGLSAPNIVTASGYPRFRHRPVSMLADAPQAGLTYNLDRRLAPTYPGSCELVAIGVELTSISSVKLCGQPSAFSLSRADTLNLHMEYAKEASADRAWADLLDTLERTL